MLNQAKQLTRRVCMYGSNVLGMKRANALLARCVKCLVLFMTVLGLLNIVLNANSFSAIIIQTVRFANMYNMDWS